MSPFLPQTYIRVHDIFQYFHSSFVCKYMISQELNYAVKRFLKWLTSYFIFTDLKILPEKFRFFPDAPSQWLHHDVLGPVFLSFCRHLGIPKPCSFRGISGSFLTSFWSQGQSAVTQRCQEMLAMSSSPEEGSPLSRSFALVSTRLYTSLTKLTTRHFTFLVAHLHLFLQLIF